MTAMKKLSETLLLFFSRLPWWLWVVLAAAAYLVLRWYSGASVSPAGAGPWPEEGGYMQGFACVLQYGLPLFLLLASAGSCYWRWKRRTLFTRVAQNPPETLARLSRGDFEFLAAELFRRRGFEVEKAAVGSGGGVDLVAAKGRERYYIRCLVEPEAGVKEVRPLADSVEADDVAGGMAIAAGEFADETAGFTAGSRIRLINGRELHRDIRQHSEEIAAAGRKSTLVTAVKWSFLVLLILSLWGVALLATEQGRSLSFATLEKFAKTVSLFSSTDQTAAPAESAGEDGGQQNSRLSLERLQRALDDILRRQGKDGAADESRQQPSYRYEIELHSGSWIYTDDIIVEDERITYTSKGGLEVSINRDEIRTLKRVRRDR